MTRLTSHSALSVPKGCRIVAPSSIGGVPLAPGTIADVKYIEGGFAEFTFTDGDKVKVPTWLELTVDHDTPERKARVDFATGIVNGALDEGCSPAQVMRCLEVVGRLCGRCNDGQ